jgi:hypothetical protein|tara:strand:+ start:543 stop:998 length:456 start_codon:yes stop_codon:yes gene_type:complete
MRLLAKERDFISKEIKKLMEQHHLKKLERLKQTKEYQVFDSERKSLYELDLEIKKLKEESRVRHNKLQNKIRNFNRRKGFHYNTGIEIPYEAYHVPLRIEWDSYGCYQEAVERDIMMNSFKEIDVPKFIKDLFNKYKNMTYKQIQELDEVA